MIDYELLIGRRSPPSAPECAKRYVRGFKPTVKEAEELEDDAPEMRPYVARRREMLAILHTPGEWTQGRLAQRMGVSIHIAMSDVKGLLRAGKVTYNERTRVVTLRKEKKHD